MANDYQGDVRDFARIVPIPVIPTREQVRIGNPDIVNRLDGFTAPRLVQYLDEPCREEYGGYLAIGGTIAFLSLFGWVVWRLRGLAGLLEVLIALFIIALLTVISLPSFMTQANKARQSLDRAETVVVEDQFTVGEYDVAILSAEQSDGLTDWLQQNGYNVPANAKPMQIDCFFLRSIELGECPQRAHNAADPICPSLHRKQQFRQIAFEKFQIDPFHLLLNLWTSFMIIPDTSFLQESSQLARSAAQEMLQSVEVNCCNKSGEEIAIEFCCSIIETEQEGTQNFVYIGRDITERKRTEAALRLEKEESERLLLNILPLPIAEKLKQQQVSIATHYDEATILFADIVDFTGLAAQLSPSELVDLLNQIFSAFDRLVEQYGLEKIKTIGDAYMGYESKFLAVSIVKSKQIFLWHLIFLFLEKKAHFRVNVNALTSLDTLSR